MDPPLPTSSPVPTISELFPHFSEIELKEAELNFDRYIALVLGIYERIETDHKDTQAFDSLSEEK